jgi:hypothetical protein
MKTRVRLLGASVVIAAVLATPAIAGAQTTRRLVITPYAGVYAPTGHLLKLGLAAGGQSANLTMKQKASFALGGNASYWLTERTAIEVGATYAFSDATASANLSGGEEPFAFTGSENAYALLATAKYMVSMLPSTSPMSLRLGLGPALVTRGGSAYKSDSEGKFSGLTDVGGAISLCTKIPVTKLVAVRLRGESYLYSARLKFEDPVDPTNNFRFDSRFQTDLLFSAGLQLAFGR